MKKWFICFCLLALPVFAQTDLGNYDTKQPIAIDADNLEVLQNENKAIFSGNVIAVQDRITLKSDRMTVHYRSGGQQEKGAASEASNVSRIDVDGNVFLSTPEETAKGDKGVYDVDKKTIFLVGNVVLTKGKNVLKGSNAEYNMATGRSMLVGADGTKTGSGRVRGLFVPNEAQQQ